MTSYSTAFSEVTGLGPAALSAEGWGDVSFENHSLAVEPADINMKRKSPRSGPHRFIYPWGLTNALEKRVAALVVEVPDDLLDDYQSTASAILSDAISRLFEIGLGKAQISTLLAATARTLVPPQEPFHTEEALVPVPDVGDLLRQDDVTICASITVSDGQTTADPPAPLPAATSSVSAFPSFQAIKAVAINKGSSVDKQAVQAHAQGKVYSHGEDVDQAHATEQAVRTQCGTARPTNDGLPPPGRHGISHSDDSQSHSTTHHDVGIHVALENAIAKSTAWIALRRLTERVRRYNAHQPERKSTYNSALDAAINMLTLVPECYQNLHDVCQTHHIQLVTSAHGARHDREDDSGLSDQQVTYFVEDSDISAAGLRSVIEPVIVEACIRADSNALTRIWRASDSIPLEIGDILQEAVTAATSMGSVLYWEQREILEMTKGREVDQGQLRNRLFEQGVSPEVVDAWLRLMVEEGLIRIIHASHGAETFLRRA